MAPTLEPMMINALLAAPTPTVTDRDRADFASAGSSGTLRAIVRVPPSDENSTSKQAPSPLYLVEWCCFFSVSSFIKKIKKVAANDCLKVAIKPAESLQKRRSATPHDAGLVLRTASCPIELPLMTKVCQVVSNRAAKVNASKLKVVDGAEFNSGKALDKRTLVR